MALGDRLGQPTRRSGGVKVKRSVLRANVFGQTCRRVLGGSFFESRVLSVEGDWNEIKILLFLLLHCSGCFLGEGGISLVEEQLADMASITKVRNSRCCVLGRNEKDSMSSLHQGKPREQELWCASAEQPDGLCLVVEPAPETLRGDV